jgi:glycine/D-amino acid oxidase-like deaminating enzyme
MEVDYLIIGQGICGTMLSWFLHKEGKNFVVIDDSNENSSSKIAAGIINPITGRRYVTTWMIETVMPFAIETYGELGLHLGTNFVSEKSIIDFFPSPQMRNAFVTASLRTIPISILTRIKIISTGFSIMISVAARCARLIRFMCNCCWPPGGKNCSTSMPL